MKRNKLIEPIKILLGLTVLIAGCEREPAQPAFTIVRKNPRDSTYDYYIKSLPKDSIKGVLVIENGKLTSKGQMDAYNMGILTVTITPSKSPLDMLTGDGPLQRIDSLVREVINSYHLPKNKWVIGGMSVEGTGAIRYVQYRQQKHANDGLNPAGVFGIDPPLDYERLWHESEDGVKRNFSPNAVAEGNFLMAFFKEKFGGSPHDKPDAYRAASPFSYSAGDGGNARWLNNIPIKIYVEPNINWWIENRRKDFYDLNAADQAALINQLKLNGNKDAELKTSYNKGIAPDGSYHPHSWSILDEKELLKWCLKLCKS